MTFEHSRERTSMTSARRLEPSAGSGDSSRFLRRGDRCYLLVRIQDRPPCTAGAARSLILRGRAAARPVLVAATWQLSVVASSRWHGTTRHRTTTQVRPYG